MALFASVLVLMFLQQNTADVLSGTELVFAFMVHRHADRTPLLRSLPLVSASVDTGIVDELVAPWGYGQLTNMGMRRAFSLGEFIRHRYDDLLSDTYKHSEIYIRSTDSTRAKMTSLAAMAAVFPPIGDAWHEDINWVPVPYTTVAAKYDYNLFELNCPAFSAEMRTLLLSSPSAMEPHLEVLGNLTDMLGFDVAAIPVLAFTLYDNYVSLQNLGYDLRSEILDLMPGLQKAAGDSMDVVFGDDKNLIYTAGPLLNEFFVQASSVIAGNDTQRLRVYSGHDINVYAFEAITRIERQGAPKYASLYSLELRRVVETGQYVVLPVYLPTPEEPPVYLQVEGCDLLCDYDRFYNLTSGHALPENEWRTECGFSEDMDIDISHID